jgi:alpha-galactosidase
MLPTKVVVIGAGSASFGLNSLANLMSSERLRGSHLALVDLNADLLDTVGRLARRLNREWDARMTITTHTHHAEALDGAGFVINSIEVPPRERLWRSDWEIPLTFGVRQPHSENGGPGGFAHAARNIGPVMQIARAMEQACPDAWFINYTNPMMRICDAVARHTGIRVVGLCHQYHVGYQLVGLMLADDLGFKDWETFHDTDEAPSSWEPRLAMRRRMKPRIHIRAAGLNHFSWMLGVYDKQTGEDLYPLFAERWANHDPDFEPLTRRLYEAFGIFPTAGDGHLSEYVPWVSDPVTKPWEKVHLHLSLWDLHEQMRRESHEEIRRMAGGTASVDHLREAESEGALEIIEAVAGAGNHYHLAVNLPNEGYITNLPAGAIVEVPGVSTGAGVDGVSVGSLPEGVAELCRREIVVVQLGVDAAVEGDRQKALQCLLLSPCITDMDVARQILDAYLEAYREHLPQFWR